MTPSTEPGTAPPELIDSHCHLDFPEFDADRDQVLARARAAGVKGFVNPGTTRQGWGRLLEIAASTPGIHPALGLHPWFMEQHCPRDLKTLAELAAREPIVAIGEIGLDFQLPGHDAEAQLALCKAQLHLARELDLPVILHVRKAHDAMLGLLRKSGVEGGICHAFNGSLQQAEQYMKRGFLFGFGGMLTYPNAHRLQRLARELPLDHLVLETDAPNMSGARHRGQRNSPEYLLEVLEALAGIRPESATTIARQTTTNLQRLLGLDPEPPTS
jgi:TatD DNase family protein